MAEKSKTATARLFVHLAREAPIGVILRRGPTHWVQIIVWHTDTDSFEFGQWFHGRIYEDSCDVSPDGRMFLYFAADYSIKKKGDVPHTPEFMRSWTAMSRPPYLTAVALWPIFDTHHRGGGYFIDRKTVYLYADAAVQSALGKLPEDVRVIVAQSDEAEEAPHPLLLRGWAVATEGKREVPGYKYLEPRVLHKTRHGAEYTILHEYLDIYGWHTLYGFIDNATGFITKGGGITWADLDQKDRLVYAKQGKLFTVDPQAADGAREIIDLNDQRFSEVIAPEWARHW